MRQGGYDSLHPKQYERLSLLIEEIGETLHVIGKIQRHGYFAEFKGKMYNNRRDLEIEIGHLIFAIKLLCITNDIDEEEIKNSEIEKSENVWEYLHYNITEGIENITL